MNMINKIKMYLVKIKKNKIKRCKCMLCEFKNHMNTKIINQ
jgi:hypothetical protein